jgi:hypothetical protein
MAAITGGWYVLLAIMCRHVVVAVASGDMRMAIAIQEVGSIDNLTITHTIHMIHRGEAPLRAR